MKLHLGSGEHYYDGWFNVDCDPMWRSDLRCTAQELPELYAGPPFTHMYLGHFLEHVPFDEIPGILSAALQVCTPDVQIAVVGPCYDLAKIHAPDLLSNIQAHGYEGPGEHAWTATTELTRQALVDSGLNPTRVSVASITRPEWPNPSIAEWQCAFLATR